MKIYIVQESFCRGQYELCELTVKEYPKTYRVESKDRHAWGIGTVIPKDDRRISLSPMDAWNKALSNQEVAVVRAHQRVQDEELKLTQLKQAIKSTIGPYAA